MKVRKAVIPAAGLGTRFLPLTKAVPKELLPIVDRPSIQYVVEEAVAAGVQHVVMVTARGKGALQDYFDRAPELEGVLEAKNDVALAEAVRRPAAAAQFVFVRQQEPLGLGHAVLTARPAVGEEAFAVLLPDDLVDGPRPLLAELAEVAQRYQAPVVAVEEVPEERVSSYGIVEGHLVEERVVRAERLVEKPRPHETSSRLAIVGRYIFTPDLFGLLERTPPGAKGEIQLTDAMAMLLRQRPLYAYRFPGRRYDTGTPLGLLEASLGYALRRPDVAPQTLALLRRALEEHAGAGQPR